MSLVLLLALGQGHAPPLLLLLVFVHAPYSLFVPLGLQDSGNFRYVVSQELRGFQHVEQIIGVHLQQHACDRGSVAGVDILNGW